MPMYSTYGGFRLVECGHSEGVSVWSLPSQHGYVTYANAAQFSPVFMLVVLWGFEMEWTLVDECRARFALSMVEPFMTLT